MYKVYRKKNYQKKEKKKKYKTKEIMTGHFNMLHREEIKTNKAV